MSTTTHHTADGDGTLPAVPESLRSTQAKLLYLALAVGGPATPDTLAERLSLPKGTVLAIARSLCEQAYLERTGPRYRIAC